MASHECDVVQCVTARLVEELFFEMLHAVLNLVQSACIVTHQTIEQQVQKVRRIEMPDVWVAGSALVECFGEGQSALMQAHQKVTPDDDVDFDNRDRGVAVRLVHLCGQHSDQVLLLKNPYRRPQADLAGAFRGPRIDMERPHNVCELALRRGVRVDPQDISVILTEGCPVREGGVGRPMITTKQARTYHTLREYQSTLGLARGTVERRFLHAEGFPERQARDRVRRCSCRTQPTCRNGGMLAATTPRHYGARYAPKGSRASSRRSGLI
jgi:hypothetical protein